MIKVVCWNIDKRHEPWRELVEMDADVALLQEVGIVPEDVLDRVDLSPHVQWLKHDPTTGYPNYDRWPMVVRGHRWKLNVWVVILHSSEIQALATSVSALRALTGV